MYVQNTKHKRHLMFDKNSEDLGVGVGEGEPCLEMSSILHATSVIAYLI